MPKERRARRRGGDQRQHAHARPAEYLSPLDRLYGYSAAEAIGQTVSILVPADHPNEVPQILERIGRGERVEPYETVCVRKDGTRVDIAVTVSPVRDAAGGVIGVSATARDITERRQLEDVLRRVEVLGAVASLAVAAAHEINNPLNVVVGNLQLLVRRDLEGDARRRAEAAVSACDHIQAIVRRLNRITRLELAAQSPNLPAMLDLIKSSWGADDESPEKTEP